MIPAGGVLAAALLEGTAAFCLLRAGAELRTRRKARRIVPVGDAPEGDARDRTATWAGLLRRAMPALLASGGALLGLVLAGPVGLPMGGLAGMGAGRLRRRRGERRREELVERQLADVAESMALAVRSGLSVPQAMEFARNEMDGPMREVMDRMEAEQQVGFAFDVVLERLAATLDTDDARFFVLVVGIHARTGGDLASALDEVARTIRHRVSVRRELRAASAQGRLSGAIMGSLPIAFFLFLSVTSRGRLGPVLRSTPGMAMIAAGLAMEGLAYLWIQRLLRVDV